MNTQGRILHDKSVSAYPSVLSGGPIVYGSTPNEQSMRERRGRWKTEPWNNIQPWRHPPPVFIRRRAADLQCFHWAWRPLWSLGVNYGALPLRRSGKHANTEYWLLSINSRVEYVLSPLNSEVFVVRLYFRRFLPVSVWYGQRIVL